ncbi:MAG: PilZ domain-containing protein [Deltaproteobacteria bacterium]|nr:PilZ domain-containing protein [Deltaproteobacteria bacterium]
MGVFTVGDDRRAHPRERRPVEFRCYIEGHRFDASCFDISAGGAFLRTERDLAPGVVAVVGPRGEPPRPPSGGTGPVPDVAAVLVGRVVRRQEQPVRGVAIQWMRCVSRRGIQPIFDLLAFGLGLFPSALPLPMPSVARSEAVGYDFLRRSFFVPRELSLGARAAAPGEARRTLEEAAAAVGVREPARTTPAPAPGPSAPPAPVLPPAAPADGSADGWTGPVTGLVDRRDSWVPLETAVEFFADGQVLRGTVRFVWMDGLYLISPRVPGDLRGVVVVTFPVPLQGGPRDLVLVTSIRHIDRIAENGLSGLELEIRSVRREPVPGLFPRYVRHLCVRMLAEE